MLNIIPPNSKLLLAISGGPDSVYLLYQILGIKDKLNLNLHLAHLNHNTRAKQSQKDQLFIKKLAKSTNLPLTTATLTKKQIGSKPSEELLRRLRYQFLRQTMKDTKSDYIVTAHNQDDQIETIIFNFIRGTGPEGLTGMKNNNQNILRPLLDTPKTKILGYLKRHKISYCIDKSNLDIKYKRNYIRHRLLPLFKKINPQAGQSISRLAKITSQQQQYINNMTFQALQSITHKSSIRWNNNFSYQKINPTPKNQPILTLKLKAFISLEPVIQQNLIKNIIRPFVPQTKQLTNKVILEIIDILQNSAGGSQKQLYGTLSISKKNDKIYLHLT